MTERAKRAHTPDATGAASPPAVRWGLVLIMIAVLAGLAIGPAQAQEANSPAQDQVEADGEAIGAPADEPADAHPNGASDGASDPLGLLLRVLEDEGQRAALVERLQAVSDPLPGGPVPAGPDAAAVGERANTAPLYETLSGEISRFFSTRIGELSEQIAALLVGLTRLPELIAWVPEQVRDEADRQYWISVVTTAGIVLAIAFAVHWLTRRLIAYPLRRLQAEETKGPVGRVLVFCLGALLLLLPFVAIVVSANLTLAILLPRLVIRATVLAMVLSWVFYGVAATMTRWVLAHLPLSPEWRQDLERWAKRIAAVGAATYFLAEAAVFLRLPTGLQEALMSFAGLVLAVLATIFVLRHRRVVADLIADRDRPDGILGMVRRQLSGVWHWLAISYIIFVFFGWTTDAEGGLGAATLASILTVAIVSAAIWAAYRIERRLPRMVEAAPVGETAATETEALEPEFPGWLRLLLRVLVGATALFLLAEVWGFAVLEWLRTDLGQQVLSSAISIALVIAVATVVWRILHFTMERALAARADQTVSDADRTRIETFVPILRNALMILLLVVVGFVILGEIGVDTAPLLAGAGVIGLAIGFGSQTLVKDVITGLFILFENTIAVGDVVQVEGHAGIVERMTIRTIQLRDLGGSVHTVPFSAVTSIVNMTKDFSFYEFDVRVSYWEDADGVIEVIRQLGAELLDDPVYSVQVIDPIEILGLDRFEAGAMVIKARLKTKPLQQWFVGREFNRRMKRRFDDLGITMPFPHLTHYVGSAPDGRAVGARISVETADSPSPSESSAKPKRARSRTRATTQGGSDTPDPG